MARAAGGASAAAAAPRRPLSALDCGPTTVTGERPSLVDPVVQQIGELLEAHAGELQDGEVEVEIRLGIVAPSRDQAAVAGPGGQQRLRAGRVDIPCANEVILNKRSGFKYHFAPGLPAEAFVELSQRLDEMCSEDLPAEKRVECGQKFEHTVDAIFRDPSAEAGQEEPPRIRLTRRAGLEASGEAAAPGQDAGAEWRASRKRRLGQLDLYTGRRPGSMGSAFDLRVALATEAPLPDFRPAPEQREEMRRDKMRKTYFFRAWRIDISTVTTTYPAPEGSQRRGVSLQTHEVEIELDGFHVRRNLDAKLAGKPHKLWELLSDFLFAARDLAVIAGETRPLALPPALPPAAGEEEPLGEAARVAFRRRYGNIVEPVLGHYLYRLAAPRGEPALMALPKPAAPEPPPAAPEPEAAPAQAPGMKRNVPDAGFAAAVRADPAAKAVRADSGQEGFEMAVDSDSSSGEASPAMRPANSWVQRSKDWEDAMGL